MFGVARMKPGPLIYLAAGVLVVAALLYYLAGPQSRPPPAPPGTVPPGGTMPLGTPAAATPRAAAAPAMSATPGPTLPLMGDIEALLAKLQRGQATPEDLAALRQKLLGANPQQAIAAIVEFLRSGRDAGTGQELQIGEGGALEGAPTLRLVLMDLLGQLSKKTGSTAAAAVARGVLETKTSADEWALSLRNVGWQEPGARPYLAAKMREMLAEPAWTAKPSAGLLEAFDVIVFSSDPSFIPALAEMTRSPLTELQRAALVALDKLSEKSPLPVMNFLNANPGELADKPMLRADYFAKADIGQPQQQAALETYLTRADVSHDEKIKLLKALATPASFVSNSLLTNTPPPPDDVARARDLTKLFTRWVDAKRFPELAGTIQQVLGRLGQ